MRGFSLIEVTLVIAIVLTVGFFSGAFPLRLIVNSEIKDAASIIEGVCYKAQAYAMAGRGHSSWGVHYGNASLVLFKGESYDNREQNFDEVTALNEKITVSGFTEIVFMYPGGRPQSEIPIVTLEWDGILTELSINPEGVVDKN